MVTGASRLVCRGKLRIPGTRPGMTNERLLRPGLQPFRRLAHAVGRAGEGETHEVMTAAAVEIDPRRGGNTGLGQHALAEVVRVVGEAADIGIDVEGAVRS